MVSMGDSNERAIRYNSQLMTRWILRSAWWCTRGAPTISLSLRSLTLGAASCHAAWAAPGRVSRRKELGLLMTVLWMSLGARSPAPSDGCGLSLQLDYSVMWVPQPEPPVQLRPGSWPTGNGCDDQLCCFKLWHLLHRNKLLRQNISELGNLS